jgi:hypothetical protein
MADDNPQAIRVKVPGPLTAANIERAIQEKLETHRTELYRNTDTVVFICKKEGNGRTRKRAVK